MKKFLKKIKDLIVRHKLLTTICFLALVVIIIMGYVFLNFFINGGNKYGDRLDGIEEVKLSQKELNNVTDKLKEYEEVTDANVRVQGKIVYIHIEFTRDTKLDKAKEIATASLEEFDEEEQEYYDFGYSLTQVEQEDSDEEGFVITGTKTPSLDKISWIKS